MPERSELTEWRGCEVVDQDGDKIGKIDEIYIDRETGKPEWAIVNTGLFGRKSSFVPLKDALREEDLIRVPYEKSHVKDAPNVDPDGEISAEEEERVYAHYGLDYSQAQSSSGLPTGESAAGGGASGSATAASGGGPATASGARGSGLRLRRVIQEDVRVENAGDEVIERRSVQERARPEEEQR